MQNKSVTKILLGIFIMGISFLGLNVFAISSATSANQCGSIDNIGNGQYSQSPTGNVITQSTVSSSRWFWNSKSALEGRYQYNSGGVKLSGTVDQIIEYKLNFYKKFDSAAGYDSKESVWHLQNAFKLAGCGNTVLDCKLGKDTSANFFKNCNPGKVACSKFSGSYKDPTEATSPIKCEEGYTIVTEGTGKDLCCEKVQCTDEPKIDKTEFEGDDSFEVTITYEKDKNVEITGDIANYITLEGCIETTPDKSKVKIQDNTVTFEVCPNGVSSIINITVKQGYGKAGESQCPGKTFKLTSKGCQKFPSDTGACSDGLTNIRNCCIDCPNPPTDDGCGSGFKENNLGCCVCDTTQKCEEEGQRRNPDSCKCECDPDVACCGVKLNTVVPFIGDCIEMTTSNDVNSSSRTGTVTVNQLNAFPFLMQGLMKILITAILIFSVIIVIVAGLMMTADPALSTYKKGMDLLKNVIISLILLGCSGLILKLINPSFFGG